MALLILLLLLAVSSSTADEDPYIGVNIGTDLSDMPHPTQVVALLKAQQIRHVRLYNADRGMLVALANTGIRVMVSIPNDQLLGIGQSNSTAANWVSRNIVAYYPATNITAICVGSEVLTTLPNAAPILVNAMKSSGSFLMLNVYPYYDYMQSNVTETGWPSKGDSNKPDATIENAKTYNSNLIRHVINKTGTPKRPGIAVSTYIYELYNEDMKPGPISEKNWGLFDPNGDPIYILRLTGSGSLLANDTTNKTYYTVKDGADPKMLQAALDWACGPGKVDCSPLLQEKPCYEPDNVIAHATYAFDTYYHRMGKKSDACDFNGVADITTTNPSHDSCIFPGSLGRNGAMAGGWC
ncbi:hypothetical protein REPUB_Repub14bG0033700 [Reevesia pubescens]